MEALGRFGGWIESFVKIFLEEVREIIKEVRKRTIPGIKAILIVTISVICILADLAGFIYGAPYLQLVLGSSIFIVVLFFILVGTVKIDRKKYKPKTEIQVVYVRPKN